MKESELAQKFIDHFSDRFEIYKEVPYSGIIDFVAVCKPLKIAVEVKTSFSFKVIEQAEKNMSGCHYSYVAVPMIKRHNHTFQIQLCSKLGVGVLIFDGKKVIEVARPRLNRTIDTYMKLEEYMKESVAGSQSDRVTAFSNTVREIVKHLQGSNGEKIEKVLGQVKYHWSSLSSAKSCIYQWCRAGVITEFKLENGRLHLTPKK